MPFRPLAKFVVLWAVAAGIGGCAVPPAVPPGAVPAEGVPPAGAAVPGALPAVIQNPVFLPGANPDAFWETVVDVVDDYFRVAHEERVRQVGEVLTEGRIDTYPLSGATILEPWRKDSVGRDQRWEATLQSIRRRGLVRIIPAPGGYLVEVQIEKELEDLERPEQATAAGVNLNETIEVEPSSLGDAPGTLGWIPLGRDPALEQLMLAQIVARLGVPQPAGY